MFGFFEGGKYTARFEETISCHPLACSAFTWILKVESTLYSCCYKGMHLFQRVYINGVIYGATIGRMTHLNLLSSMYRQTHISYCGVATGAEVVIKLIPCTTVIDLIASVAYEAIRSMLHNIHTYRENCHHLSGVSL